jgi:hypothetical protein
LSVQTACAVLWLVAVLIAPPPAPICVNPPLLRSDQTGVCACRPIIVDSNPSNRERRESSERNCFCSLSLVQRSFRTDDIVVGV